MRKGDEKCVSVHECLNSWLLNEAACGWQKNTQGSSVSSVITDLGKKNISPDVPFGGPHHMIVIRICWVSRCHGNEDIHIFIFLQNTYSLPHSCALKIEIHWKTSLVISAKNHFLNKILQIKNNVIMNIKLKCHIGSIIQTKWAKSRVTNLCLFCNSVTFKCQEHCGILRSWCSLVIYNNSINIVLL